MFIKVSVEIDSIVIVLLNIENKYLKENIFWFKMLTMKNFYITEQVKEKHVCNFRLTLLHFKRKGECLKKR